MKWVIFALWAVMSFVLTFKGAISATEAYLGASMMMAAEYVAEKAKDK